jgi:Flp pilus assembly protein TadB
MISSGAAITPKVISLIFPNTCFSCMLLLLALVLLFFIQFSIERKKKFQGFRDEVPNVLRFLNEIEKRLSAPSNFDGSTGDNL